MVASRMTSRILEIVRRRSPVGVTAVTDLYQLEVGWNRLVEANQAPMQTFAWATAAAATETSGRSRMCFVLGDIEDPLAIAPVCYPTRGPLEFLITAPDEPQDFLYRDPTALAELCKSLADLRVPLKVLRVFSSSPTVDALSRAYAAKGLLIQRKDSCPVVKLDESWVEPERRLNPGRRSDFRRARRRAEALGTVTFDFLTPEPASVDELLNQVFAVEAAGWKGRAGTALAVDQARAEFFRTWAPLAASDRSLRIAFMRVGGHPVAVQLAAERGNRLWLLKIGYDEAVARCSPGGLLMLEVLRISAYRKLDCVEFLGRSEPWTKLWATEEREVAAILVFPRSSRSLPVLLRDAMKHYWKVAGAR
jgi:CelD/BcsL family acetyltransferase involved in cellulose biosynthesis